MAIRLSSYNDVMAEDGKRLWESEDRLLTLHPLPIPHPIKRGAEGRSGG